MSKARNTILTKLLAVFTLDLFMVAQHPGVLSSAEAVKATTAVKHKPLKHFVAGHRISVGAKVSDPQGVSLVRCYFRAAGQADYVFVGMKAGEKNTFTGVLPAPAAGTKRIEYLFLAVNGKNQVVKTQIFGTELKAVDDIPDWQRGGGEGKVAVSADLPRIAAPTGFNDSITFDVVESSMRFGIVAGIYGMTNVSGAGSSAGAVGTGGTVSAGGATGAAAMATSAGTVVASAGLSTTVIVGASVAVAAVGVGAAVAGGGGDDSTGDGDAGVGDATRTGCGLYEGNWAGTLRSGADTCPGAIDTSPGPDIPWTGVFRSDCTATMTFDGDDSLDLTISGDTISGSLVLSGCGNIPVTFTLTVTLSGSSLSGTFSASDGISGNNTVWGTKQ